jgi:DNA-directed RNA polymerase specialized sigma24 family protein
MDLLRRSRAYGEFERFAAVHADELIRTAYLMVGDRGDAEDIVQECMLRLARKWPRVRKTDFLWVRDKVRDKVEAKRWLTGRTIAAVATPHSAQVRSLH